MKARRLLFEEDGFASIGMVVALLLTLSLIFSAAQVYRVSSASADVQDVADAAALAAENEVAEFMIVVRVCDAVVLSLSLAGVAACGLGVAALCIPVTAAAAEQLLSIGTNLFKARDAFSEKAKSALDALQKALPFTAAANAASVAAANKDASGSGYLAVALLSPDEGDPIDVGVVEGVEGFQESLAESKDEIAEAGARAEELAQEANAAKERAFARDCGDAPGYCMYERASTLASLGGADNPLFRSVDAWSFDVALDRARAYYQRRIAIEAPQGGSVEEQARSALRERFYRYAASELARGYVRDDGDSFDAYFPRFPRNTDEMRETSLYTEAAYPVTQGGEDGGSVMHAWDGCPAIGEIVGRGSVSDMEAGGYPTCSVCGFKASSLGSVAAASTSIENGFEHHYDAVAREAAAYEEARDRLEPLADTVKSGAGSLIDQLKGIASSAASARIDARPPGTYGATAFVVNLSAIPAQTGFETSFVSSGSVLGARAAVSAATLIGDPSGEGESVLSSLLDSVAAKGGAAAGIAGVVLDGWTALLHAYARGQQAIDDAIESAADALPLESESGLGSWAAGAFSGAMELVGLEPAELDALKPVVVNSSHVANADAGSAFSARFLSAKDAALALSGPSGDVFSSVVTNIEHEAFDALGALDEDIEIATIRPLGEAGPEIPITIALPPSVKDAAEGLVERALAAVRSLYAQVTGVRAWT